MKKNVSVLQIVVAFLGVLGLVVVMNTSKVFAQEDNVMYVSELQVGDYIPAGTVLLTEKTYVDMYSKKTTAELWLGGDKFIELENNESTILEDAATLLGMDDNYEGWVVTNVGFDYYDLSPANSDRSSQLLQIPGEENGYSVEYQCPPRYSGDIYNTSDYTWYKYKSITNPSITSTPAGITGWIVSDGNYEVMDSEKTGNLSETKLSFEFTAEKDDIVAFEVRGNRVPIVQINGVAQTISEFSSLKYNTVKLRVVESGNQKLDIIYHRKENYTWGSSIEGETYGHVIVRNINLLTTVNEGNQLDITKVSSGDNICYECSCDSGYLYKNSFRYVNGDQNPSVSENIGSGGAVKNPATSSNIIYIVILITVFGFSLLGIGIRQFRKNNKY